jgi:Hemerythrin HHE cation binding domain
MAKARPARKRTVARTRSAKRAAPARRTTSETAPSHKKATRTRTSSKSRGTKSAARKRPRASKTVGTLGTAVAKLSRVIGGTLAAVAERVPWVSGRTDAIDCVETDHRRLEDLLKQGEDTTERGVKTRNELLAIISTELGVHEMIEEKILYPALKAPPEVKDIVLEGYQEHHVADLMVKELHALSRSDERWGAKFKVLKENIEHHIEEEEGKMFKTARRIPGREQLEEIGERMQAMKTDALRG